MKDLQARHLENFEVAGFLCTERFVLTFIRMCGILRVVDRGSAPAMVGDPGWALYCEVS